MGDPATGPSVCPSLPISKPHIHAIRSRFHTRFYVAFLPSSSTTTSGFSHGTIQHRLPTPDGGLEVIAARFIHPLDALAEFRSSKIALMPPQYYLITTLASILHGREATLEQQARIRELAAGAFGSMVINPRGHPGGQDQDGRSVLTYEGDETRGGSKGRLHRSLVKFGKKGVSACHCSSCGSSTYVSGCSGRRKQKSPC